MGLPFFVPKSPPPPWFLLPPSQTCKTHLLLSAFPGTSFLLDHLDSTACKCPHLWRLLVMPRSLLYCPVIWSHIGTVYASGICSYSYDFTQTHKRPGPSHFCTHFSYTALGSTCSINGKQRKEWMKKGRRRSIQEEWISSTPTLTEQRLAWPQVCTQVLGQHPLCPLPGAARWHILRN